MRTRSRSKRSRGRKQDVEFLSLRSSRRRKVVPLRPGTVWNKALVFRGPMALAAFRTNEPLQPDEFVDQCVEILSLSRRVLSFSTPRGAPFLPPQLRSHTGRKTLVLDIDETLVHSVAELHPEEDYDATFDVTHLGTARTIGMKKRPHVDAFLAWCGEHFEVVTFTSSIKPYADQVLDRLDPYGEHVKYRLYREHCTVCREDAIFFKDLEFLRRDLSQTVLVDNSPMALAKQIENGVPIQAFYGDETGKDDTELLKLKNFLEEILPVKDVREVIKQRLGLTAYLENLEGKLY